MEYLQIFHFYFPPVTICGIKPSHKFTLSNLVRHKNLYFYIILLAYGPKSLE